MTIKGETNNHRLLSLDALRGFDMIWILGAEEIFSALHSATNMEIFGGLSEQFEHSEWNGFTFYDLIFPLFIFLSGVTLGIARKSVKELDFSSRKPLYISAIKRLVILFLLGIVYNHGWGRGIPVSLDEIRYASVLSRIGIAWFFCAMIVWHFSAKTQYIIAASLLIGYWLVQQFVPTPDGIIGSLTSDYSWNAWIDKTFLPGHHYRNLPVDPEGLFSHIPAVVNALCGAFAGRLLMNISLSVNRRLTLLLFASFIAILIAYIWSLMLPFNKTLWTSSFALICIGYSGLLLAAFYWLIDYKKLHRLGYFFAVIGANSILLYLLSSISSWHRIEQSLFSQLIKSTPANMHLLVSVSLLILLQWSFANFLYKRRIFLHV